MFSQLQTFSILFRIAKARANNSKAPISVRITINGQRSEISTHRTVSPFEWDSKNQLCTAKYSAGLAELIEKLRKQAEKKVKKVVPKKKKKVAKKQKRQQEKRRRNNA